MRLLRVPLAGLALAGFLLALWVHVSALRAIDVSRTWPQVWSLHVGLFAVFVPMVLVSRRILGRRPTMRQWRELLPGPIALMCGALFIYALVNFLVSLRELDEGSPAVRGGQFVLQEHGRVTPVSAARYEAAKATQLRMFSGHWMFFYFLPFSFFAFGLAPRTGSGTPPGTGRR